MTLKKGGQPVKCETPLWPIQVELVLVAQRRPEVDVKEKSVHRHRKSLKLFTQGFGVWQRGSPFPADMKVGGNLLVTWRNTEA